MIGSLFAIILRPIVDIYNSIRSRRFAIFELLAVALAATLIAWYIYSKVNFNAYKIDVKKVDPSKHLADSYDASHFIGPKKSQSKMIRSLGDVERRAK